MSTIEEQLALYKRAVRAWSRATSIDCQPEKKSIPPHIGFSSDADVVEAWNALNGLPEREEFFAALKQSRTLKVSEGDLFATALQSELAKEKQ